MPARPFVKYLFSAARSCKAMIIIVPNVGRIHTLYDREHMFYSQFKCLLNLTNYHKWLRFSVISLVPSWESVSHRVLVNILYIVCILFSSTCDHQRITPECSMRIFLHAHFTAPYINVYIKPNFYSDRKRPITHMDRSNETLNPELVLIE